MAQFMEQQHRPRAILHEWSGYLGADELVYRDQFHGDQLDLHDE